MTQAQCRGLGQLPLRLRTLSLQQAVQGEAAGWLMQAQEVVVAVG